MTITLEKFIAGIAWPDLHLAATFMEDADLFWGTEEGRKQILAWGNIIGRPSQFLERELWTVKDLIEHGNRMVEWERNDQAATEAQQREELVELKDPLSIKEASEKWHEAVEQRKENLALSKAWLADEIKRLKKQHIDLDAEWTAYVTRRRNELKQLRGY